METTSISPVFAPAEAPVAVRAQPVKARAPWTCTAVVFAAICILVGIVWDISWHETIAPGCS